MTIGTLENAQNTYDKKINQGLSPEQALDYIKLTARPGLFIDFKEKLANDEKLRTQADKKKAKEAFDATHEGKILKGPAPVDSTPSDVLSRLQRMGISPSDNSFAANLYFKMKQVQEDYPDITPEEFKDVLTAANYSDHQITKMMGLYDKVKPIAEADLGLGDPERSFADEVSRKNYLIANHFTDDEINDFLKDETTLDKSNQERNRSFPVPQPAKEKIALNDLKYQGNQVKLSTAEKQKQVVDKAVQNHNEFTLPDQTPEMHTLELRRLAAELQVEGSLNQGAFKFPGKRLADVEPEELEAQQVIADMNPNTAKEQERRQKLEDISKRHLGKDTIRNAANPLLNKATSDLDEDYRRRFGDAEDKFESSIIDKMNRNYLENIAPSLKQKFLTAHVRGHGHLDKELGDVLKKSQEGTADAIAGHRIAHRGQNYAITSSERERQLKGADLSARLAKDEIETDEALKKSLQTDNKLLEEKQLGYAEAQGAVGVRKGARKQKLINDKIRDAQRQHDFPQEQARIISDMGQGHILDVGRKEYHLHQPEQVSPTGLKNTAAMIGGAGSALLIPKKKEENTNNNKEGGRIQKASGGLISDNHMKYVTPKAAIGYLAAKNKRTKLAQGGQVDPNLVQNAVFDKVSPTTELMRDNRRNRLYQLKNQYDNSRKKYAVGGNVSPLAEGISMAKTVVSQDEQEKEYKQKTAAIRQQIMNPEPEEEESMFHRALTGGMRAVAAMDNDGALARTGRSYMAVHDAHSANKDSKRKREAERQKSQLEVMRDYQKEVESGRNYELEKQKANTAEETAKAQRSYYGAHARMHDANEKKIRYEMGEYVPKSNTGEPLEADEDKLSTPALKMKPADRIKMIDRSSALQAEYKKYMRTLIDATKAQEKASTGSWVGSSYGDPEKVDPGFWGNIKRVAAGIMAGASPDTLRDLESKFRAIVAAQQAMDEMLGVKSGSKNNVSLLKLHKSIKPTIANAPSTNFEALERSGLYGDDIGSSIISMRNMAGDTPRRKAQAAAEIAELNEELKEAQKSLRKSLEDRGELKLKADSPEANSPEAEAPPENIPPATAFKLAKIRAEKQAKVDQLNGR